MQYFSNLFFNRTLHVSDRFTVHHQESSTVYTVTGVCRTVYVDCLLADQDGTVGVYLLIRFSLSVSYWLNVIVLLVECYFIIGSWIDYIYSGSSGEFKCDYCFVYFETIRSYDYDYSFSSF